MRRWGHIHSVGTGTILGVYLAGHVWIALAIAFALGLVLGRAWHGLKRAGTATAGLLAARVATETERRKNLRAARRAKLETARSKRQHVEKAFQRGYIEGKLDA